MGLGKTLQTSQRYEEAINAYRRSLYLKRVNDGVYSLSQAPMLRGIIESHIKQGQTDAAAENYEQLVWIHLKDVRQQRPQIDPPYGGGRSMAFKCLYSNRGKGRRLSPQCSI